MILRQARRLISLSSIQPDKSIKGKIYRDFFIDSVLGIGRHVKIWVKTGLRRIRNY